MHSKPDQPEHLQILENAHGVTRAVVFNRRCLNPSCGGPLLIPRAGRIPETCSPRCRVALCRHRKRQNRNLEKTEPSPKGGEVKA